MAATLPEAPTVFGRPLDAPSHQPAVVFTPDEALRRQPRKIIAVERPMMGTTVSVQIAMPDAWLERTQAAAVQCMTWLEEVNARLSRFDPGSEISLLNRSAGGWFAASETLFTAVEIALAAAQASGGLFDPTLLRQIEALGYDCDFAQIAHREVGSSAPLPTMMRGAWQAIELDHLRRRIRLPEGVALDLGGIAKGWAADVAFERYCAGFPGVLINVGGDLRAQGGPQYGQGWTVGVRDPRGDGALTGSAEPAYVETLTFSQGGLATSGAVRRWWLRGGARQHHLLDPRTGRPARLWMADEETSSRPADAEEKEPLIATATALAPTATQAEVAAKLALLRGAQRAIGKVNAAWDHATHPLGPQAKTLPADYPVALLLTFGTGSISHSRNFQSYLDAWATERI